MGYKALKIEVLSDQKLKQKQATNTEVLENKFYKLIIDKTTGSISSLFDKELNQELADGQNLYDIGQPVRETINNRRQMTPSPRQPYQM